MLFKGNVRFNAITFENIDNETLPHSYINFSKSTFESDFEMHDVTLPTHCWFEACILNK